MSPGKRSLIGFCCGLAFGALMATWLIVMLTLPRINEHVNEIRHAVITTTTVKR